MRGHKLSISNPPFFISFFPTDVPIAIDSFISPSSLDSIILFPSEEKIRAVSLRIFFSISLNREKKFIFNYKK